jgi:RNA polymerase sigma-70 factor, ECF subfamily
VAASTTVVRRPVHAVESVPAAEGARLLYERYYDRVFGYCLYQLGSREEAEDATQTTFLWAFRGLRRGVVPRAEDSWLFTIAKNSCRARHRARGRKRQREVISDPHVLADISSAPSRQHNELIGLEEALARMPELQRRAILLREWQGLSYREIAAELDITGAAVETLIFRARRSLAELLDGKAAPKRARRFAFDFTSIGVALKTALGGASAAKLTAGLAAALLMATTLGGSIEERVPQPKATASVGLPSAPAQKEPTAKAPRVEQHSTAEVKKSRKPADGDQSKGAVAPEAPVPHSPVGQPVDETVGLLPSVSQVTDTVPLETVTGLVDKTAQDASKTVDDALTTIDDALTTVDDAVGTLP